MSKAGVPRRRKELSQRRSPQDFKIEEHNAVIQMAVPKVPRVTVPAASHVRMATAVKSQAPRLERRATGRRLRPFDPCRDRG